MLATCFGFHPGYVNTAIMCSYVNVIVAVIIKKWLHCSSSNSGIVNFNVNIHAPLCIRKKPSTFSCITHSFTKIESAERVGYYPINTRN